jgi:hypothetical protein
MPRELEELPESVPTEIEFNEKNHRYKVNGEYLPSVTTIIDKVVPKNLSWWAMVVGVHATTELIRKGVVTEFTDAEDIVTNIRNARLSVYHIRDEKGEEGSAVHKALENYARTGEVPDLGRFHADVRLKVRALANFLIDFRPRIIASEVRVASLEYGYAGMLDLVVDIDGKTGIIDLKTGKRIYPDSQFPQVEAYRHAYEEMGNDPVEFTAILHLDAEGEYHLEESTDTFYDFKVLLDHYYSAKERELRLKGAR